MSNDIMTTRESFDIHGWFSYELRDANGEVKLTGDVQNLIVNEGISYVAGLLEGANTTDFDYMAIGTGTVAAAATDTSLGAQVMINATTNSLTTTTVTNDTAQWVATFNFTSSYAITEAGLYNGSTGGTTNILLSHQVFSAINVSNGDSLQITWRVQVS